MTVIKAMDDVQEIDAWCPTGIGHHLSPRNRRAVQYY